MKLNIDELLAKRKKSRYWLAKEIGVSQPAIRRLATNTSESTKFETIENLCIALECTPNELFTIEKTEIKKDL